MATKTTKWEDRHQRATENKKKNRPFRALTAASSEIEVGNKVEAQRQRMLRQNWQLQAWCVDEETEILTTRGWLRYDEVAAGDLTLTLDHETGFSEWQPIDSVNIFAAAERQMMSMESRGHSSLSTLNHRWPVLQRRSSWTPTDAARRRARRNGREEPEVMARPQASVTREWKTSETLNLTHALVTAAQVVDLPTEAKYSDAFVELMGWFWTEGTYRPSGYVEIGQSQTANPEMVVRIRAALTKVFGPSSLTLRGSKTPAWREWGSAHGMVMFALNSRAGIQLTEKVNGNKIVDFDFILSLTRAQLELFIQTSIDADGHRDGNAIRITQSLRERLDPFMLALILSGRNPHLYEKKKGTWAVYLKDRQTVNPFASANTGSDVSEIKQITHEGIVWCPTTLNKTWLARRNGTVYFTGNTLHDSLPELSYANGFLAHCASRMRLFPAAYPLIGETDNPIRIDDPLLDAPPEVIAACTNAMSDLGNGRLAIANILEQLSLNFSVTGEAFLLGLTDPETLQNVYSIRSVSEIVIYDDDVKLREGPMTNTGVLGLIDLPEDALVERMWQPHPQFRLLAQSPMRALINVCEDLQIMRRLIRATGRSRLAGRGILFLPSEMSVPNLNDDNGNIDSDEFLSTLTTAMMTPIRNEGDASGVVPLVVQAPGDQISKIKWIEFASVFDEQAGKIRAELTDAIATGLDLPQEIFSLSDLNHWCKPSDVEIFTINGWRNESQLSIGDSVLTLNHNTGLTEWQPVLDIYRADVVDEPMVRMRKISYGGQTAHDSISTFGHRWPIIRDGERAWSTSTELHAKDRITVGAEIQTLPDQPKYSDAFVELAACYSADGTAIGMTPQVRIGKSHKENPDKVDRLRRIFTELFGPAREGRQVRAGKPRTGDPMPWWKEDRQRRGMTLFCPNKAASAELLSVVPGRDKVVPLSFIHQLTRSQLSLFLNAFIDADGAKSATQVIGQAVPERLDSIELAAILLGHGTHRWMKESGGFERFTMHMLSIRKARSVSLSRGTEENYTGTVWCPTTENRTWLARSNGLSYFTGNSAFQVDMNTFRYHIEIHVIKLVEALTGAFLRPYFATCGLEKDIVDEWLSRLVFWYDPTELVTPPDLSMSAQAAHDSLVISDAALRKYRGFKDSDGPNAEEIEIRMIRTMRTWPANVVMELLHVLDPELNVPAMAGPPALPGIKPGATGGADVAAVPTSTTAPALTTPSTIDPSNPIPSNDGMTASGASESEKQTYIRILRAELVKKLGYDPYAQTPIEEIETLVAAAKTGPTDRELRLSRKLTQIDSDLRMKLQVAANAEMRRQLEKASHRVRQSVSRDKELKTKIARTRNEFVALRLSGDIDPIVAASYVTNDWTSLEEQFKSWTGLAQRQALAAAQQLAGDDELGSSANAVIAMSEGVDKGWKVLRDSMDEIAQHLAYNPDPNMTDDAALDALNPDTLVPTGVIRCAVGVAGGSPLEAFKNVLLDTGATVPAVPNAVSVGGVASGATISNLLTSAGATTSSFEWSHGPSEKPFSLVKGEAGGHLILDGVEFNSFTDPALANPNDWPDNQFFLPGDHAGCLCDATALWVSSGNSGDSSE